MSRVGQVPQVVVGLGNPGREYEQTRHNVGFRVLDRVAKNLGCDFRQKSRFFAFVGEAKVGENRVWLVKPLTFMNRSGETVRAVAAWKKIGAEEVLVIVDDADLPLGKIRLRKSGSSGGHNGLRSIAEHLGGENFPRLRVGIGRRRPAGADITDHVLSEFSKNERPKVEKVVATAAEAVQYCLEHGVEAAMNKFNRRKSEEEL
jgi:PTH1 family peptidyl-tRNA hydrolase